LTNQNLNQYKKAESQFEKERERSLFGKSVSKNLYDFFHKKEYQE
jgi:hypothetical protein